MIISTQLFFLVSNLIHLLQIHCTLTKDKCLKLNITKASIFGFFPPKILSGSPSYFDEYLKGYLCVKFGAFAKKLTIFSQICWTIMLGTFIVIRH